MVGGELGILNFRNSQDARVSFTVPVFSSNFYQCLLVFVIASLQDVEIHFGVKFGPQRQLLELVSVVSSREIVLLSLRLFPRGACAKRH